MSLAEARDKTSRRKPPLHLVSALATMSQPRSSSLTIALPRNRAESNRSIISIEQALGRISIAWASADLLFEPACSLRPQS